MIERPIGERLAVVESQIHDFRDWQRETDRTLGAVKDSLNRIEAQMVSQQAFGELKDKLDGVVTAQEVKKQVDTVLDERNIRGTSFKVTLIKVIPVTVIAVLTILALLTQIGK